MSNVFQDHPWLNYVAVAVSTWVVNGVLGKARKLITSPSRDDFQALEARISGQIAGLQSSMSHGMQVLAGDIKQLGTDVYKRIDEKHDALSDRIDKVVLGRSAER